jgi:predicted molibdopterin-dependent oxidoreductase YjgC
MFLTDYANQRGVVEEGLRPVPSGLSAWEMLQTAAAGGLDALLVFADDPFEFFPAITARAFERVQLVLVVDAVKTATAARADIVLPGALLAEKQGTVVNTEGRVQSLVALSAPPGGCSEGEVAARLADRLGDAGDPGPPAPWNMEPGGGTADEASMEYPFLAALDTTLFWNTHALVRATTTAWREARSFFADFPPGCVTLNPEDARRIGATYAATVRIAGADGSTVLPVRLNPRMLPGTAWLAMRCWEHCGNALGALEFDPALRIPVFRPRAVRLERPDTR